MTWNNEYSVGVNNIDNQHLRIMTIINDLHMSIQLGRGRGAIKAILVELMACTRVQFQFEEELLKVLEYPEYEEHVGLHDEIRNRIHILHHVALDENEPELVLIFLKEWWRNHILVEDMKYSEYVTMALST
jgi:hemerythrin